MSKDLMYRPYGRFYHIPLLLTQMGHNCTLLLLNYRNESEIDKIKDNMRWVSISLSSGIGTSYIKKANNIIESENIDWVIGFSDIYYGVLAQYLAKKHGIKSLIDAYDNYESYINWLKPLHWLWRRSISHATKVTAAGPSLAKILSRHRKTNDVVIIPIAADPEFNSTLDRNTCRKNLGLPEEKSLIGYCGSIYNNRGIKLLFSAFDELRNDNPDVMLVLSGRKGSDITIPEFATWLGYIDDQMVPCLIRSLDLLVVMNIESNFGNYSYPVKIYEAAQSGTPVLAMKTQSTAWITGNQQELLCHSDNPAHLSECIKTAMKKKILLNTSTSWLKSAQRFEKILRVNAK